MGTVVAMEATIRIASADDLGGINEIYNEYIVGRNTSFDTEPWTLQRRRSWFQRYRQPGRYHLLVSVVDGAPVGFASSSPFRDKPAYHTSVETTIVFAESHTGRGLGGPLLGALLDRLGASDVHRAYALIVLPNEPSIKLHARMGYGTVGVLEEVGHKLGTYHSVQIMEKRF